MTSGLLPAAADAVAEPEVDATRRPLSAFRLLWRWYRPNMKGLAGLQAVGVIATILMLVGDAVMPLIATRILQRTTWSTPIVALFVATVLLILVGSFVMQSVAASVSIRSATHLRERIFGALPASGAMRQVGLVRSSVVTRHTGDVENVSRAVLMSMEAGIPGLMRVLQSLVLLTIIDWPAGLVMIVATSLFLVAHHFVGARLLVDDQAYLDADSRVGEIVDESVSGARTILGIRIFGWQQRRFGRASLAVEAASRSQGNDVTWLAIAAQMAGLAGLTTVVILGIFVGGTALAGVAGSLLYIQAVVTGLVALPPWVRSLQLAVVSRRRIDQVLTDQERRVRLDAEAGPEARQSPSSPLVLREVRTELGPGCLLQADELALPASGLVGVVVSVPAPPDALLGLLAGETAPDRGRVTYDGSDVAGGHRGVVHIPDDTAGLNVSVLDLLRSVSPGLTEEEAVPLLRKVDLGHLLDLPGGLHAPMGPGGRLLTGNERQLLMLAAALSGDPQVLLLGGLLALSDPDTALSLISRAELAAERLVVLPAASADLAESVDQVMFVGRGPVRLGTHRELLTTVAEYAEHWHRRVQGAAFDLAALGVGEEAERGLRRRLVTEHFAAGEMLYRQGSPAGRAFFIISGNVEITTADSTGNERRVAVLGPGNHCGDLRLAPGETRSETARAVNDCVVTSLGRDALAAGVAGLLDRPPGERRVLGALIRRGPQPVSEIERLVPGVPVGDIAAILQDLIASGAVSERDGVFSPVLQRRRRATTDVLDRLQGIE